ncbi:MAG: mobile mystery protein B [Acidimicrobiia bacterium]
MTDRLVPPGDGHTELSDEDRQGLIPTYIATRGELFDAEERNIVRALRGRSPSIEELLDDAYLRRLHKRMFGRVWSWAGAYRLRETNIGIAPTQIPGAVRNLAADTRVWVETGVFRPDELAARFHHRLVYIHPFPNGNGRHGRIAADYLILGLAAERFTWGATLEIEAEELRAKYVNALQQADDGDYAALIEFVRL